MSLPYTSYMQKLHLVNALAALACIAFSGLFYEGIDIKTIFSNPAAAGFVIIGLLIVIMHVYLFMKKKFVGYAERTSIISGLIAYICILLTLGIAAMVGDLGIGSEEAPLGVMIIGAIVAAAFFIINIFALMVAVFKKA